MSAIHVSPLRMVSPLLRCLVGAALMVGAAVGEAQGTGTGAPRVAAVDEPTAPAAAPAAAGAARAAKAPIKLPLVLPALMGGVAPVAAADGEGTARPAPFARYSRSAARLRDSVVALARAQIGKRYVWGAESPKRGFDCSGLVQYVAQALNIKLPRTAREQALAGKAIEKDTAALQPGDLVTFASGRSKRISHIGIYVGNGKIIHASSHSGRVVEAPLIKPRSSLTRRWRGAVRVLADDSGEESGAALSAESGAEGR